ncbi:MAG: cupin domain-containing protein [Anaerovoracaceae bacterium]
MAETNGTVNGKHSMDMGPEPYVTDVDRMAVLNKDYRNALWTGEHLQMTLMTIPPGGDIGKEIHSDTDQFIRVEQGRGIVSMGADRDMNDLRQYVRIGDVVFVPAGTWHNVANTENFPLRLSVVYGPPHHPRGTVYKSKAQAETVEH